MKLQFSKVWLNYEIQQHKDDIVHFIASKKLDGAFNDTGTLFCNIPMVMSVVLAFHNECLYLYYYGAGNELIGKRYVVDVVKAPYFEDFKNICSDLILEQIGEMDI